MKKILSVILVVCISLSILVLSLEFHTYSLNSYKSSYNKYDLGVNTGKTEEEFLDVAKDIIDYLEDDGDIELMERNFDEREVKHMVDVQGLFKLARIIKYISLVIVATIVLYEVIVGDLIDLLSTVYKGLSFNYLVVLLFILMINIDFTKYFTYFHKIFFDNDLWILNPKTDLLIQMMPENFFVDMVVKIGLTYFIGIIFIQIGSYLGKKYIIKKDIKS